MKPGLCHVSLMLTGPLESGSPEGNGAAPGKALPPWLLRQGITSISSAAGPKQGGPLTPAGAGGSTLTGAAPSTGDPVASEEEDQKRIEVRCDTHASKYHFWVFCSPAVWHHILLMQMWFALLQCATSLVF